jgi:ribosomal protein L7/L12
VEDHLRELVRTGQKIEAVKQVTRLTGASLRVAKDYVDGLVG